jgi:hypothetical protein
MEAFLNIKRIVVTELIVEITSVWLKAKHSENIADRLFNCVDVVNVIGCTASLLRLPLLNLSHLKNI